MKARGRWRVNWRQISTLYKVEMRSALRDRTIVLNSILIPIFLFPFLFWAAFNGIMFVSGQAERVRCRVAVESWPDQHPRLRRAIERDQRIELVSPANAPVDSMVRRGELDAFVRFVVAGPASVLPENFTAEIVCNTARERSRAARDRLKEAVDDYRADWLKRESQRRGISPAAWQGFTISMTNVASQKEMGTFLLGLIVPVLFVIMVAIGSFYPAIDTIAGERERNTWETLMSTSADRLSIVTAKYLYVATVGALAGALNLGAMLLTIKPVLAPLLRQAGQSVMFQLPLASIPLLVIAAVLLAAFVAAGMMIFSSFARTFKEGQAMISPFYIAILAPIVFLQVPGLHLTLPLSFVPIANVTLMIRDSLSGRLAPVPACITLIVSAAMIVFALKVAAVVLRYEDVMLGSYRGSFGTFLRQRFFKKQIP